MRGARVNVTLHQGTLSEAQALLLNIIPGVRSKSGPQAGSAFFRVPLNAADVVEQQLQAWGGRRGIDYSAMLDTRRVPFGATPQSLIVPPEELPLQPGILERLYGYQRRGLAQLQATLGGLAVWPCGSGKTLLGTLWAISYRPLLSTRQRIVIVTRPGTTEQWRSQIQTFTQGVSTLILEGQGAFEARESRKRKVHKRFTVAPGTALDALVVGYTGKVTKRARETLTRLVEAGQLDWKDLTATERKVLERAAPLVVFEQQDEPDWKPWHVINKLTGQTVAWHGDGDVVLRGEERQTLIEALHSKVAAQKLEAHVLLYRHDNHYRTAQIAEKLHVPEDTVVSIIAKHAARQDAAYRSGQVVTLPDVQVVIVGWAVLSSWVDTLTAWEPDSVVLDESHNGKAWSRWEAVPKPDGSMDFVPKANASAAAMVLCHAKTTQRVLALTATPTPDRIRDLWAQLDNLQPYCWGKFREFGERYCDGHEGTYGYDTSGESHIDELGTRIQVVLHQVTKDEYRAEVPELRRQLIRLSAADVRGYKPTVAERREKPAGGSSLLEFRLGTLAALKHPWLVNRVEEVIEHAWKVVIFTGRTKAVDRLGSSFASLAKKVNEKREKLGLPLFTSWATHGETSSTLREQAKAEYMAHPGPCVFVGTSDAWGEGVDGFQDANLAIIAMLPWNHGKLTQNEGRFDRLQLSGEPVATLVEYPLLEGTIEEEIYETVIRKGGASANLLDDSDLRELVGALAGGTDEERLEAFAAKLLASAERRGALNEEDDDD